MITWIAVVSLLVLFPAWKERNLKFVHRAACFLDTFNIKSLNRIRSVHFYSRVSCMGGCVLSCVQLLRPQGLQPARLLCPWDSPGNNTAVGCPFLVQEIFPTQTLTLHLLLGRILYHWTIREALGEEWNYRMNKKCAAYFCNFQMGWDLWKIILYTAQPRWRHADGFGDSEIKDVGPWEIELVGRGQVVMRCLQHWNW